MFFLFTDGSCKTSKNSIGGWAFVIKDGDDKISACGVVENTTSNRMELEAAIQGLAALIYRHKNPVVHLITDSQYLKKGIEIWLPTWKENGNWKNSKGKATKNLDLWKKLAPLVEECDIEISWVPGHSGNIDNELCDALATCAVETYLDRKARGVCTFEPRSLAGFVKGTIHCPICDKIIIV